MEISQIHTWSTFEDAIPVKERPWEPVKDGSKIHRCFKHGTLFDREEEPCWACYNPYE